MAITAGPKIGSLPPAFMGFDRIDLPESTLAPGTRWMRLLFAASTYRIVGAYLQYEKRHWHDHVSALRDDGWGSV